MLSDGLWTGEFATSEGSFGGGVVLLSGEQITGGDSGYVYTGNMVVEENDVAMKATLKVEPFMAGFESVFRTVGRAYTLDIVGKFASEDTIVGHGTSPEFPGSRVSLRLSRRRAA